MIHTMWFYEDENGAKKNFVLDILQTHTRSVTNHLKSKTIAEWITTISR